MKRLASWMLYVAYLAVMAELGARAYWVFLGGARFFAPAEALAYAALYPEVHSLERMDIRQDDEFFDVLLLGGSTLTPEYGDIPRVLLESFTYRTKLPVRVHLAAAGAQTSRDSFLKYRWLSSKRFDLVLLYDGINEASANNCPPEVFRPDYSHYAWYRFLNDLDRYAALRKSAALMTIDYFGIDLLGATGVLTLVPTHQPRADWLQYGAVVKTAAPFRENVMRIAEIAAERQEPLVLMTFAYYMTWDYSPWAFAEKTLDYTLHDKPIEMWGVPAHVVSAISAHNRIIREIAAGREGVTFVDQEQLIPKHGDYWNDICHFTHLGTKAFVANLLDPIAGPPR